MTQKADIPSSKDQRSRLKKVEDLCICDIVNTNLWDISILPKTADIGSVVKILTNSNHVWIVNDLEKKKVVGIITEADLLQIIKPRKKFHMSAMSSRWKGYFDFDEPALVHSDRNFLAVEENDSILDVMDQMTLHDKNISAVVDKRNRLIGEITFRRILQIYLKMQ